MATMTATETSTLFAGTAYVSPTTTQISYRIETSLVPTTTTLYTTYTESEIDLDTTAFTEVEKYYDTLIQRITSTRATSIISTTRVLTTTTQTYYTTATVKSTATADLADGGGLRIRGNVRGGETEAVKGAVEKGMVTVTTTIVKRFW